MRRTKWPPDVQIFSSSGLVLLESKLSSYFLSPDDGITLFPSKANCLFLLRRTTFVSSKPKVTWSLPDNPTHFSSSANNGTYKVQVLHFHIILFFFSCRSIWNIYIKITTGHILCTNLKSKQKFSFAPTNHKFGKRSFKIRDHCLIFFTKC